MKKKPTSKKPTTPKKKGSRPKVHRLPSAKKKDRDYDVSPSNPKAAMELASVAEDLAVGHQQVRGLSPHDVELFKAFQKNLVSLISHELRTPLTGILNSLNLLSETEGGMDDAFSAQELVGMARRNAQRLHQTLVALLDLVEMEAGSFHATLKEVSLKNLVRKNLDNLKGPMIDNGVSLEVEEVEQQELSQPILADPRKTARMLELSMQVMIDRGQTGVVGTLSLGSDSFTLGFEIQQGSEKEWDTAWEQARVGIEGGVHSALSAFGGVVQSEEAFLTRSQEGLGSEFLLLHEIMKLHRGEFRARREKNWAYLDMRFPRLESMDGVRTVLLSRVNRSGSGVGNVVLALIDVPQNEGVDRFCKLIKASLFRTTDAAYALPERGQVALIMDDCKKEDTPRILGRIEKNMKIDLIYGAANCPEESVDPDDLIELAQRRRGKKAA